jgi:hypothetical protein
VKSLLNIVGQTFIISGFMFFVLAISLYYVYPPLYTNPQEYASNLIFISCLGLFWTLFGIYPVLTSALLREINVGDLVKWNQESLVEEETAPVGIVIDKDTDVPIGWFNEDGQRETVSKYKIFWQDLQGCGWHWEEDIIHYKEPDRGE